MTKFKVVAIGSIGFTLHWLLHFGLAAIAGGLIASLNPFQLL